MRSLTRLADWRARYRRLTAAGVTRTSAVLLPAWRRAPGLRRNQLKLTSGEVFVTGRDDRLVMMFDEIWAKEAYLPGDWTGPPAPVVVDIGANVGVFAVWAARRLGAARIVAVEPSPPTAARLRRNLERNRTSGATVLQAAVGARTAEAVLYRRGQPSLSTLYEQDVYGSSFSPEARVRVVTLGEIFEEEGIDGCDLLKLDCEGAEYEILFAAGRDTLDRIRHIVGEYHEGLTPHRPMDLFEFLESHGFSTTRFAPLDEEGGVFHATRRSRARDG